MLASMYGRMDIVAFLLQLPAVKASINAISDFGGRSTALFYASGQGHQPVVQPLLDAGADHTIPAGPQLSLNRALGIKHQAIAALLRHAINEAKRVRECVAWVSKGKEGMCDELCRKVRGFPVHAWADKGLAAVL